MAWGSSFDKIVTGKDIAEAQEADTWKHPMAMLIEETGKILIAAIPDKLHVAELYSKTEKHANKVPTHDPYTNPNAHIYYECKCGKILDPGTKRFAELNNCASNAGWKIRFSDTGYIPYCVTCGEGVE